MSSAPLVAGGLAGLPVGRYIGDIVIFAIERGADVIPANIEEATAGLCTVAATIIGGWLGHWLTPPQPKEQP